MSEPGQKSVMERWMDGWMDEGGEVVEEEWVLHFAECHSSSKY